MVDFISFNGTDYVKVSRPEKFNVEAKKSVAEETNKAQGTKYSHKKSYHKSAGLSINHKVSIDDIMVRVIRLLNSASKNGGGNDLQVKNEVKFYDKEFMTSLCSPTSSTRDEADFALAILQSNLVQAYGLQGHSNQEDTICDSANALVKILHNSPDNLRNGFSNINSAVQENLDLRILTTNTGDIQFSPRSKEMGKSSYRLDSGMCTSPGGSRFLSSDSSVALQTGNLTPDSKKIFDGLNNRPVKKSKYF